ncbi:SRPRB protein, partial [Oreotrochilus melanogaster]|nr:SRPRB protein [Oreotrochilus melanogaster]
LFPQLLTGRYRDTQTSITDSSALYRVSSDKSAHLTLIDLPGHESLRLQFLERFKAAASCAVGNIPLGQFLTFFFFCFSAHSNTLRVTRSAAPTSLDGAGTGGPAQLGKKGKDFDFSQLPMKVEFVECSARGSKGEEGDADFEGLEKWLARIA